MPVMQLRLYVAGDAPNSVAARTNLRRLLETCEPGSFTLEIIDCLKEPMRALQDGVLVTPTLVRFEPLPKQTIVGTLSELARVTAALGVVPAARSGGPVA